MKTRLIDKQLQQEMLQTINAYALNEGEAWIVPLRTATNAVDKRSRIIDDIGIIKTNPNKSTNAPIEIKKTIIYNLFNSFFSTNLNKFLKNI